MKTAEAPALKMRPLAFRSDMVQAILDGTKTQTRRISKLKIPTTELDHHQALKWLRTKIFKPLNILPGDIIWVREQWRALSHWDDVPGSEIMDCAAIEFRHEKTWDCFEGRIRPARFLPLKFANIFLKPTHVRLERLQDITPADAMAEGILHEPGIQASADSLRFKDYLVDMKNVPNPYYLGAIDSYKSLWESINGPDSWTEDAHVWVIEFERIHMPNPVNPRDPF